jgi:hypothetical protein
MPTPPAPLLETLARQAIDGAGLRGDDAPRLATALGQTFAQVLTMFATQTQVLPGIPAAVDPITTSGSTVGPGLLLPPPAGGPSGSAIESLALGQLRAAGLLGEHVPELAKVIGQTCEIGLSLLCASVQVAPGIAVAGLVTVAPGRLV